ncbi:MAG: hypothetical protein Q7T04_04895 [Dehalococcoidia bacterium]|nr:hypothetical protein [Dehalococcoidia bacterium]
MAKKKVFLSFDFDNDLELKNSFLAQAGLADSPFSINDYSLREAHPDNLWLSKAQSAVAKCDLFIVILGDNTHKAPGVLKEVKIAAGLGKERFQLRPQGSKAHPLSDAGKVVVWKWKNIKVEWS